MRAERARETDTRRKYRQRRRERDERDAKTETDRATETTEATREGDRGEHGETDRDRETASRRNPRRTTRTDGKFIITDAEIERDTSPLCRGTEITEDVKR